MTALAESFSLQAAETWVYAQGTPVERAAWKAGFGCGPVEVLVFELEAYVNESGVWSGLAADESPGGLASTLAALRLLATVNLGEDIFELGARTLAQLQRRRFDDGSWDAPGAWPGQGSSIARRAWYTASLGGLVGQLSGTGHQSNAALMAEGAARWVQANWHRVSDAGPAFWWAVVGCIGQVGNPQARRITEDAATKLLRWLDRPRSPSDVAWIHEAARSTRRGSGDPLRRRTWEQLAASQGAEGGWAGGSEAGWPVSSSLATYFASRALVRP